MSTRNDQLSEALRTAAAEFLSRESNRLSLITVTAVRMSEGDHHATIFVTVLPEAMEEQALQFANRNRGEFGKFFETKVRARIPRVEFVIDRGEKMRQRLDELTN